MRAVNEADPAIETIVRSTDPSFLNIAVSSGRVELGGGVTMAAILAERELAFLHPVARAVGSPALREAATVGGNLFATRGDFATALLALDATVMLAGGFGQRELSLDEFISRRERGAALVSAVAFKRPPAATLRFAKVTRDPPQGHVGPFDRGAIAADERPRHRRADRLCRHGPDATEGKGRGAGARGTHPRRRRHRSGAGGGRRRNIASRRCDRQRLVATRNPSHPFAPTATRREPSVSSR